MSLTNKEAGHLKHPLSREKLRVLDKFASTDCTCGKSTSVTLVESDMQSIKNYLVVSCSDCKNTEWYMFPAKS